MDVPACCPHCEEPLVWSLSLRVTEEVGFAAPHAPGFFFACPACEGEVRVSFCWQLEQGGAPRQLQLVGGASPAPQLPQIVLVDSCPHGCGIRLGLQLDPEDPLLAGQVWPDTPLILGGYRCPRCDGEGRLVLQPVVEVVQESRDE